MASKLIQIWSKIYEKTEVESIPRFLIDIGSQNRPEIDQHLAKNRSRTTSRRALGKRSEKEAAGSNQGRVRPGLAWNGKSEKGRT